MNSATKANAKTLMMIALCICGASKASAAEGHGFFGIFKKKKEPEVRRAQPVYPNNSGGYQDSWARPETLYTPWSTTDAEWRPVVEGTIDSMNNTITRHWDGLQNSGIGIMYGPKSAYASMTPEQQKAWIEANKKPGTLPPNPARTSCIDFVLAQLRQGYARAGKLARFEEIKKIVVQNEGQGTYLLKELEKDGWTMVYWNPDEKNPSTSIRTDADPQHNHRPDHHKWTAATVNSPNYGHTYMKGVKGLDGTPFEGIKINDKVTDFRPTNPYQTKANEAGLQKIYNAPLFVGIANGGYHVYLGTQGKIVESHSTRQPNNPTNIEVRDFANWGLKSDEGFGSGVIAVPPGAWELGPDSWNNPKSSENGGQSAAPKTSFGSGW